MSVLKPKLALATKKRPESTIPNEQEKFKTNEQEKTVQLLKDKLAWSTIQGRFQTVSSPLYTYKLEMGRTVKVIEQVGVINLPSVKARTFKAIHSPSGCTLQGNFYHNYYDVINECTFLNQAGLEALVGLENDYLIKYYGVLGSEKGFWLLMDYTPTNFGVLLAQRKQGFPEEVVVRVILSVIQGLDVLFSSRELNFSKHGAVVPEHILVDGHGRVKLGGYVRPLPENTVLETTTAVAYEAYISPECLTLVIDHEQQRGAGEKSDVWSLGVTIIELATGDNPYRKNARTFFDMLVSILNDPPPSAPKDFSSDVCNFAQQCLTKDFDQRSRVDDLMNHPLICNRHHTHDDIMQWIP